MEKIQRQSIAFWKLTRWCYVWNFLSFFLILTFKKERKKRQKLFIRNQTIDIFNPRAPWKKEMCEHGKGTEWIGTFFCLSQLLLGSWIRNGIWHDTFFLPFCQTTSWTEWERQMKPSLETNEKRTWSETIICFLCFSAITNYQIFTHSGSKAEKRRKKLLKSFSAVGRHKQARNIHAKMRKVDIYEALKQCRVIEKTPMV